MVTRRQWLGGTATLACWMQARQAVAASGFTDLPAVFARIEAQRGGRLGVAVLDTATNQRTGHRQDERFPLGSTFKLLAAGAVLARADAGQDRMDRRIHYAREDLVTYSPETEKHAGSDGMTLAALCEAAITLSDNTAGNLLLGVLGGPKGLTDYLHGLGDVVTRLDRTEPTLNEARPGDPRDTTSPASMLADMQALTVRGVLSEAARTTLQGGCGTTRRGMLACGPGCRVCGRRARRPARRSTAPATMSGCFGRQAIARRCWSQPTSPKARPMAKSAMPPWPTLALPSLRLGRFHAATRDAWVPTEVTAEAA